MPKKSMKQRVMIVIDDPFDFALGEGEGRNNLSGEVIGFWMGPDKENWRGEYVLIRLDKPFEWEGNTVRELIASDRYGGDNIRDIGHKELIVGIAYVKPGAKMEVGKEFRAEDVTYSFIGHIKEDKREKLRELYEKFRSMRLPQTTGGNKELGKLFGDFIEWDAFVAGLVDSFVYHNHVQKKYTYMHEGMGKLLDSIVPKSKEEEEALNYYKEYNKRIDTMLSLLKEIIEEERL